MKNVDVIIIGAGAAGLLCAITAAQRGRTVTVLERANKAGRKILMSGGGRCNFTNLSVTAENFISHNSYFCRSALSRYSSHDFIELVESHAIPYYEKTLGQLFCQNRSSDIVNMLLAECKRYDVQILYKVDTDTVKQQERGKFTVFTSVGSFQAESCVIATGGLTVPSMGSNPFGYRVAEQFGLNVYPTRAALVPLTWRESDQLQFSHLSGLSLPVTTRYKSTEFSEGLLFTHRGLSGPAMLQISSYWKQPHAITVNLFPAESLSDVLYELKSLRPNMLLRTALAQKLPAKLVEQLLASDIYDLTLQEMSRTKLQALADSIHHWTFQPNGTEGYRTAEVTLGGVDTDELSSKTMMSKSVMGLYFIGEVVDVTGWLGGYNFQWAWSSGFAAGSHA
jgi:predicted Rossmann fold flavoprotein